MFSRIIPEDGVRVREMVESWGTSAVLTEGSLAGAMYVVPSSGLWGGGGGGGGCCECSSWTPFNFPSFFDFRAANKHSWVRHGKVSFASDCGEHKVRSMGSTGNA